MGIETSIPFGCTFKVVLGNDRPACDAAEIDASSTRCTRSASVRWSWSTSSTTRWRASPATPARSGAVVNAANFLETATFWQMEHCEPADGESTTTTRPPCPTLPEQQDAIFGAIF